MGVIRIGYDRHDRPYVIEGLDPHFDAHLTLADCRRASAAYPHRPEWDDDRLEAERDRVLGADWRSKRWKDGAA